MTVAGIAGGPVNRGQVAGSEVLPLLLAGNSRLTFENEETGRHFTYRVRQPKDAEDVWFVQLLSGQNNETDYRYIGAIFRKGEQTEFRHTRKSTCSPEAPGFRAFDFVFRCATGQRNWPDALKVWHEGRCCRCGRTLTVPESVASGIGPECAGRMAS